MSATTIHGHLDVIEIGYAAAEPKNARIMSWDNRRRRPPRMPLSAPRSDEFDPFYAGYISRVANVATPVDEFVAQRARLLNFLSPLSDEQALYRYAPGKWSIKELVGHLSDGERVFAYRLLRIGRGDETPLSGFEENDYVRSAGSDHRPFGELLDEWAATRDAPAALVRGMPAE